MLDYSIAASSGKARVHWFVIVPAYVRSARDMWLASYALAYTHSRFMHWIA